MKVLALNSGPGPDAKSYTVKMLTPLVEGMREVGEMYINNPVALQLRGMNMLFEGLKEKGSLIIVPSAALESMNLGAIGGLSAISKMENNNPQRIVG